MSSFGRADLSNVKKGDKLKLRNGNILQVDDVCNWYGSIRVKTTQFMHDVHGVRLSNDPFCHNIDDVVEVIPNNFGRADLTNVKVGDRLKDRMGRIRTVTDVIPSGESPIRAGVFYGYNGVSNISSPYKENDLDIIEILPSRVDVSNVRKGDKVKLRDGSIKLVTEDDPGSCQPICVGNFWYKTDGAVNIYRSDKNDLDIIEILPAEIKRVDVSNVRKGDKVKLRNGEIKTVTQDDPGSCQPICVDNYWYKTNGVYQSDEENSLDIVEIIPADNSIDYKDLLKRVTATAPVGATIKVSPKELKSIFSDYAFSDHVVGDVSILVRSLHNVI